MLVERPPGSPGVAHDVGHLRLREALLPDRRRQPLQQPRVLGLVDVITIRGHGYSTVPGTSPGAIGGGQRSRSAFSRCRSAAFALPMARVMTGAVTAAKPEGSPVLRSVILVAPSAASSQM